MDFHLKGELFFVAGATSGFGRAIAELLLEEGANVIINARTKSNLEAMKNELGERVEVLKGDITSDAVIADLFRIIQGRKLSGVVINAGGPPAMSFIESNIDDWDKAYNSVLRWKVKLTQEVLDKMMPQAYGRILFIESISVKQPVANLVLSNALRLGVVGMVKTVAQEVASYGVTVNILAPGYHNTPAMERLFRKKAAVDDISVACARQAFEDEILMGKMGEPEDFASIAVWLLSQHSRFITGQTISVDGGLVKGIMG